MPFHVNWDNGANASGTFPESFETEEAAIDFATDWEMEMRSIDGYRGYEWEVIEDEED